MMYGAEDDPVDIGENDSGSVGGLLDGAEDDLVDVGKNDNGGVGWTIGRLQNIQAISQGNQSIPVMDATEVVMVPCLLKM